MRSQEMKKIQKVKIVITGNNFIRVRGGSLNQQLAKFFQKNAGQYIKDS